MDGEKKDVSAVWREDLVRGASAFLSIGFRCSSSSCQINIMMTYDDPGNKDASNEADDW